MSFTDDLKQLEEEALQSFDACETLEELKEVRSEYLGQDGRLRDFSSRIGELPEEKRPEAGRTMNEVKQTLQEAAESLEEELDASAGGGAEEGVDITEPGIRPTLGTKHPLYETLDEICELFARLGFDTRRGPEVETEFHNFEALNIPLNHPAREAFDNYYLEDRERLLRSHTSPMQIRIMEHQPPPIRSVVPGKVYRPDEIDASHHQMFHQVEGLLVDDEVTMGDLKGTLTIFCRSFFGEELEMRFRPSYFPFTEPSAEVDISCFRCGGDGCSLCGGDGWLEVLGCGMVHPHVFESVEVDPDRWDGFAFGLGVERLDMLRRGIDDIRLYTENNREFLEQFC